MAVADGSRPLGAFTFEASGTRIGGGPAVPVNATSGTTGPEESGLEIEVRVGPHDYDRLSVTFTLPEGIVPASSTLVGAIVGKQWQARYVNLPREGLVWRATLPPEAGTDPIEGEVWLARPELPGGETPAWLQRENVTWQPGSVTVLPIRLGFSS